MKVSAFVASSVDGYIARSDGSLDWMRHAPVGEQLSDFGFSEFYQSVDVMVVGRNTFTRHLGSDIWPYGNKRIIVMSRRYVDIPATLARHVESTRLSPQAIVEQLARDNISHVYVDGGKTIQSFLQAGLISELTITKIPVLLGQGIALFGPTAQEMPLEQLGAQSYPGGVVQIRYRLPT